MGYRSDVVFAVDKKTYVAEFLAGNLPDTLSADWIEQYTTDDAMYWRAYQVKWYDGHPEEGSIIDWLENLEEIPVKNDKGKISYHRSSFGFIRIGDEHDDVEMKGDPYDYGIEFHRHIEAPF
jgi:hypothetical protein